MSDKKHYYYLKLKEGFFDSDPMILLESMPDGYIYSNILLKLYLRSLKSNGKLMLNNRIPYSPQMIANVARVSVGVVEKSLKIFEELGLIEILDNGAMYMADIQSFIGESSTEADRKRVYRSKIQEEKKLMLGQTVGQMSDECPPNVPTNLHQSIEIKDIELNNKNISVNDFPGENLPVETAQGSEPASKQVSNHSMNALELIEMYNNKNTLLYIDPPYLSSTRTNLHYHCEFSSESEHKELLRLCKKHRGHVIISTYDNELYNAELDGWEKQSKRVATSAGGSSVETIYLSPSCTLETNLFAEGIKQ